ncbi:hypothetical protein ATU3B_17220 [Agrobacterium genomosp. 3 str. CIP 111-78]|uniref:Uncharacterized protein n=1 Tax=Agrobacterium tumefaciens TaxID=358 RepID=A0AAE6BKB8_AGRTU|nr:MULTISPECIES: hypothetical protein [Agrobacterium tumefaciens complex]MCA2373371.1 hypothetical protein [Agrobacterium tomkonis CIP 111-78]QCL99068.1 hypothetical protein CFBP6624_02195 [Agrobacterium tumefaciens]
MMLVAVSLATLILLALSAFQVTLAAGAPFGRFAWGGASCVLPVKQRIASVASLAIYGLMASFPLQKTGFATIWPAGWIEPGIWITACYLAVSVGLNAMSKSRPERLVMTPIAAVLAILFFVISLS